MANSSDASPEESLCRVASAGGIAMSRPASEVADIEVEARSYTPWRRKCLEDELQLTRGELREARQRAARVEEELRTTQRENARLRHELSIQRERDELLRSIHDRVSEASLLGGQVSQADTRGRYCTSVCALFGRR